MAITHSTLLHPPTLRSYLVSAGYFQTKVLTFFNDFARQRVFRALRDGIVRGTLTVEDGDDTFVFGSSPGLAVTLQVCNPDMWTRILISSDLGVSEAYMEGEFHVSSLKDLLNLWLDNRLTMPSLESRFSAFFTRYSALAINALGRQNVSNALWNVEVAYNTSNTFYQCFLSKEMMYSCAIWGEEENGVRGDLTVGPTPGDLESAQRRKIRTILTKARVRAGDRLLEIGSGWGAMATEAARLGCTVDTITLSYEQMVMTERRALEAGVSDRVRVHLCDYRRMPPSFEHAFDAMVTCEMIEAVGPRYMHEFVRCMDWALKRDKATMVITATSQPEFRYTDYQPNDFARHYHWPNCHLPCATSVAKAVQEAAPGSFTFHNLEDHGPHYCRTLREWGRRLDQHFKGEVVEELQQRYPQLRNEKNLEAFKRKWHYMFVYSEVGYARSYTTLNCWTFTRPENVSEPCA
ncbi:cyclopropane fatty acid synthase [Ganoderma leucocontextum]|nr:cyclopropane fatty acid synthase [Ganoderma leucocontextum]